MKITVWGINYAPEVTGIAPYNVMLCEYLRAQGHEVDMLTSFPYYPSWRKQPQDVGVLYRSEVIEGVRVHRCWHYVPSHVRAAKRILHEASFVCSSFLRALLLPRPEVMVVVSPPLLLGLAAAVLGFLRRAPFVFHVQDLQPDAAVSLGMVNASPIARGLYWLEGMAYRFATRVSGITRGMLEAFKRKGVPPAKCVYFPNSVRTLRAEEMPARGEFRARFGFDGNDFLAVYSGNFGVKQGLRILVEAAPLLKNPRVKIVICGDGAERLLLEAAVKEQGLTNVLLLPLMDSDRYAELMTDTDLSLITQKAGSGRAFFPSKLLATLGFGKPVLCVSDSDRGLAYAVQEGSFGLNLLPGRPELLAQQLDVLAEEPEMLDAMAERGRTYVARFESSRVFADFERCLYEIVGAQPAKAAPVAERIIVRKAKDPGQLERPSLARWR